MANPLLGTNRRGLCSPIFRDIYYCGRILQRIATHSFVSRSDRCDDGDCLDHLRLSHYSRGLPDNRRRIRGHVKSTLLKIPQTPTNTG